MGALSEIRNACAKPSVLQGFGDFPPGIAFLRFGNWWLGYRAQPSGLRRHPAFSPFEFSHSLVNITQWLTAGASLLTALPGNRTACRPRTLYTGRRPDPNFIESADAVYR